MEQTKLKKNARQMKADALLLMVALVWGLTFVSVKSALVEMLPFTFNAIRFTLAFLFMLLFLQKNISLVSRKATLTGIIIGSVLFTGYSFQTIGLQYTTASNAGFITGLSVVFVPLFSVVLLKQVPSAYAMMGAFFAALGLSFLSLNLPFSINIGDLLVLFCAVSFALHIILVGRYIKLYDTLTLVTIQIGTVAALSAILALLLEKQTFVFSPNVVSALLVTAIPATALAYLIQNWAQRFTTPTRTAIIFSMEPVFSAIFAVILLAEVLSAIDIIGGILVLSGMLLAELKH